MSVVASAFSRLGAATTFTGVAVVAAAAPVAAEPATTVAYADGGAPARFNGRAFDTCAAPSAAAMKAWRASPYRAIGVYVSGASRTATS